MPAALKSALTLELALALTLAAPSQRSRSPRPLAPLRGLRALFRALLRAFVRAFLATLFWPRHQHAAAAILRAAEATKDKVDIGGVVGGALDLIVIKQVLPSAHGG